MAQTWLLLRHGGCLWGVARDQVQSISRPGEVYRLELGRHLLEVDEVMSFVALQLRRFGPVLGPLAPPGCSGMASCSLGPVMMIDAESPPSMLRAPVAAADQEARPGL